ncbi:MAG: sensor histidine kinase [Pirellulaceae bacterium]
MRLSDFILREMDGILEEWDAFAATYIPAAATMSPEAVRDHAKQILLAVVKDLSTHQSIPAQMDKTQGLGPEAMAPETPAETHAVQRAKNGFNLKELIAEYRSLRGNILQRWLKSCSPDNPNIMDVLHFNEAIDKAISESVDFFTAEVDRSRNVVLAMLSHDMRNPLTTISMTASFLDDLKGGVEVSTAVSLLTDASHEMMSLLDDMVDLNRTMLGLGITIAPTDIDMATVFAGELELLRGAHPGCQLDLDVSGDTHGCWDGPRLRRVLRNLVSNALKYGTRNAPVSTVIVGDATEVRFEVTNSGPTIDPSNLEQIFDLFNRGGAAAAVDASQGLGLFIVREIVRAHGGEVHARSSEETTVFDVRLPRRVEGRGRVS